MRYTRTRLRDIGRMSICRGCVRPALARRASDPTAQVINHQHGSRTTLPRDTRQSACQLFKMKSSVSLHHYFERSRLIGPPYLRHAASIFLARCAAGTAQTARVVVVLTHPTSTMSFLLLPIDRSGSYSWAAEMQPTTAKGRANAYYERYEPRRNLAA